MARIEIDPNYSSPTFPRATAGTDLFKKEDVQALASAMSTHDHTTGKGLLLAPGSIPNGTITSAMIADGTITGADIAASTITTAHIVDGTITGSDIGTDTITTGNIGDGQITSAKIADGTIATADIATNAVWQWLGSFFNSVAFGTTTTGAWVATPITVSITTSGGMLLMVAQTAASHQAAGGNWTYGIGIGAAPASILGIAMSAITNHVVPSTVIFYAQPAAGAHTITLYVNNGTAGTLTFSNGMSHTLFVSEHKR